MDRALKLRRWRGLIWLLALPALWWVVRSIPLEEIWSTLDHLALWQIGALVVLNLIILLLFTSRWWLVLRVLGYRPPLISLVGYRLAGFGISYFTPGPQFGGEPLQIQLTRQKHKVPTAAAVAAVSLDKLLELLTNFSFILIGAVVVLRSQIFSETLPLPLMGMAVAIFMLPAGYMLAIWLGRKPITRAADRLTSRLPIHHWGIRAVRTLASAEEQLVHIFRQKPTALILIALLSGLVWLLIIAEYWLTISFLGESLAGYQVVMLLTAARVAFLLPSPGGLGTLEASQILVMGAFGLSPALAISASLLIRGRDLALGSLGLWLGAVLVQRRPAEGLPSQAYD